MAELPIPDAAFDIERGEALGDVPHGFFGSGGGVHQFGFGGPGDVDRVRTIRAAAADAIVADAPLVTPHQVHSPDVITVTDPWDDTATGMPVADALVTARKGLMLGIVTADCAPVLFADGEAGIVGAAHAGWRGAHGGVLENTIIAMERLGATRANIAAAIGPTIAQQSYEVDDSFRENFTEEDAAHFADAPARAGLARWHFDLPGYVAARLNSAGLRKISDTARDTFATEGRYFSYRRASARGAENYGRQLSVIAAA